MHGLEAIPGVASGEWVPTVKFPVRAAQKTGFLGRQADASGEIGSSH